MTPTAESKEMTALDWHDLWRDASRRMAMRVAFVVANDPKNPNLQTRLRAVARRALAAEERSYAAQHRWYRYVLRRDYLEEQTDAHR